MGRGGGKGENRAKKGGRLHKIKKDERRFD
jgi:hypothetical protein